MPTLTLEDYQTALTQRTIIITQSNRTTAHIARQMLSPICTLVQQHLIQEFKAHFSNPANRPKYFYKQGWALRSQECTYLEALITRANITKDDAPLVEALSWIQRQAPAVGYLGSGRQYEFQKELSNVLNRCDKEAAPTVDIKVTVPLEEIVTLRTNAAEGSRLANSLFIAAQNNDEKAKTSVATILQTQDLKKSNVADCIGIAILEMDRTTKHKFADELRDERAMREKTIRDSQTQLSDLANKHKALQTKYDDDFKTWQNSMQTQIVPNFYDPNKNITAEGSCSVAVQTVINKPSASAPPPSLFYAQPSPAAAAAPIVIEGGSAAQSVAAKSVLTPAAAKKLIHS